MIPSSGWENIKEGGQRLLTVAEDGIGSLLGDGIDSINDTRDVAKEGQYKTDPKLHLHASSNKIFPRLITFYLYISFIDSKRKKNIRDDVGIITSQPYLRKTPRGGKIMAKRISTQVAVLSSAMFLVALRTLSFK